MEYTNISLDYMQFENLCEAMITSVHVEET